ncbi:hypothetical protein NQ315_014159 [Exocentrus adspersus]|uniref:Uncharacterized protein n=1 Tax=Exocentrus adspersus TaxID=1586481 RepID=A0AAV8VVR6_9CUCU|nr:hypothetical protein NQ315_014159 [Exocentrus adspersus]
MPILLWSFIRKLSCKFESYIKSHFTLAGTAYSVPAACENTQTVIIDISFSKLKFSLHPSNKVNHIILVIIY